MPKFFPAEFNQPYVCPVSNQRLEGTYIEKIEKLVEKKKNSPGEYCEIALGKNFKKEDLVGMPKYYLGLHVKLREIKSTGSLFLVFENPAQ